MFSHFLTNSVILTFQAFLFFFKVLASLEPLCLLISESVLGRNYWIKPKIIATSNDGKADCCLIDRREKFSLKPEGQNIVASKKMLRLPRKRNFSEHV